VSGDDSLLAAASALLDQGDVAGAQAVHAAVRRLREREGVVADDAKDIMTKWTTPPIVAENEQLKARVIELEAELATIEEAAVRNGIALQREAREHAAVRIAELEDEVATLREALATSHKAHAILSPHPDARIAELEANLAAWQKQAALMEAALDRLRGALRPIEREMDLAAHVPVLSGYEINGKPALLIMLAHLNALRDAIRARPAP
jgi:chromosome segregation ATPase